MPYREFEKVYRSCKYDQIFNIRLTEDELDILLRLFNPNNLLRLFGVIKIYDEMKTPRADAKAHIQIDYYTTKTESKYPIIKNQLSIAKLYAILSRAIKVSGNLYEAALNPILLTELEYSVSHDILRELKDITEKKEELKDEVIEDSYRKECEESILNKKREIELYENILNQITKTIGKDGIYLVQNDMEECELEKLNGLKLHLEACRKGGI